MLLTLEEEMMNFVALNASPRKKGNSELLSKLVLREASKNGADKTELINLREFKLEQCNGCMRCIFNQEQCPLEDDFYPLIDKIVSADALFLTAPVYVTSIPGKLKMFLDRALLFPEYYNKIYGRPAMSVAVASPIDWESFQLPLMNMILLGLGFYIRDSFIAHGAGPGEVLLEEESIQRLSDGISKACHLVLNPQKPHYADQISKHCPVCFSTVLERLSRSRFRCPVCLSEAENTEDGLFFLQISMEKHRWTPGPMEEHYQGWIAKTKGRFKDMLRDIMKKKKALGL